MSKMLKNMNVGSTILTQLGLHQSSQEILAVLLLFKKWSVSAAL